MKKILKNEHGFTLIEMMIVLLIISVLILISIPNVTSHSKTIDDKGCKAFVKMVEGQVAAYKIENKAIPTLAQLQTAGYLSGVETEQETQTKCPNGDEITIDAIGKVTSNPKGE